MARMIFMATAKKAKAKEEKPKHEAKEEIKEPVNEAKEEEKEIHHAPAHAHAHDEAHAEKAKPKEHEKEEKTEKAAEKAEKAKPKEEEKAEKKVHISKAKHPKRAKLTLSKGKRKRAIARVIIQQGKGRIRINKFLLDALPNKYYKQLIREVIDITGPRINEVDVDALVTGGGIAGQMQAVRTAIASGLVDYFNDDSLARAFEEHGGRTMIVNDTRRVEPKKYRGPKARARYQKSYR
jgi:small subunit ribosomal protein S9